MVSSNGHLKLIDFGTAKDLVNTDLNGPEFVGTPEFMSPETVKSKPAGPETDLWSYGVVMWQLLLGTTPFKAPSPYLGFLKIKRGLLYRHPALSDDAWDLLSKLIVVDPAKVRNTVERSDELTRRLHSNSTLSADVNSAAISDVALHLLLYDSLRSLQRIGAGGNLADVKGHPFLASRHPDTSALPKQRAVNVPSLRDLCIREVAELAVESSLDLNSPEPGSGAHNDMLRMNPHDRECVMHFLDRLEKVRSYEERIDELRESAYVRRCC